MTSYLASYLHDPDAVLDYNVDFSDWLADGETVSSHTVTVDGVTKDSDSEASGVVTAWISGGTAGESATVAFRITTSAGRTDERTIRLTIGER